MTRLDAPASRPSLGTILVVDDVAANVRLFAGVLAEEGYTILTASSGDEAFETVVHGKPDLVVMDVRMPGRDGISVCREIKRRPETRLLPVVLMTAFMAHDDRLRAIEAGADDFLGKPVDLSELSARVRSLLRLKRFTDDLDSAESLIMSLALTVEARDPCTEGHCYRLATYSLALGRRLGLSDEDLAALRRGAYLHDVGKIAVPDSILLKPGRLTPDEYALIRRHPEVGDGLCGDFRALRRVRPIVRHHHERLDGSGYPDGLSGDAIPLLAGIIGVVDVYDAITSVRSYKVAEPPQAAFDALRQEAANGWRNKDLVELLIEAGEAGDLTAETARSLH